MKKVTFDHLQGMLEQFNVPAFDDLDEFIEFLKEHRQEEPVMVDLETTGLNYRHANIRCVGISIDDNTGMCVPWPDASVPKQKRRAFVTALSDFLKAHKVVGHNVSFDYRFLIHNGVAMPQIHGDTMTLAYLLDQDLAEEGGNLGLADLVETMLPKKFHGYKIHNPQSAPMAPLMMYCVLDCILTYKVYNKLRPAVDKKIGVIKDSIFPLQTTLLEIDMNGIKVHSDRVQKAEKDLSREIHRHLTAIYEDPDVQTIHKFNPSSPTQVKKLVYELKGAVMPKAFEGMTAKRKSGKVAVTHSTKAEVLQTYTYKKYDKDDENECIVKRGWTGVHHMLLWKRRTKLRSTYIKPAREALNENNTFFFNINIANTKTGRLSATRGAHNMPKIKYIRDMFVCRPGCKLIEADYSQLEYRVLAHEAQDQIIIQGVKDGIDFHTLTAMIIYNKKAEDVTKTERSNAKNVNFAVVYGAGGKKLAQMLGMTVKEAERFLEEYKRRLPQIWAYRERTIAQADRDGFVITPYFGRIRYMDDDQTFTQAVNTKIQSASADVMAMSLIALHKKFKKIEKKTGYYCRIIGTVHDSVLVECEEEIAEDIAALMKKVMENGPWKLDVPLAVDIKMGYSWGDMEIT